MDDLIEKVQIFTLGQEQVVSLILRPKGSTETTDDIEIIDDQDWSSYPPELHRVPHTIGWFDAERLYIYSSLIRRKTRVIKFLCAGAQLTS